jgi:hypothetical protein
MSPSTHAPADPAADERDAVMAASGVPELDEKIFNSTDEARRTAFDYIDCYYNRIRRHSAIGGTIPDFEKRLAENTTSNGRGNAAHVEIAEKQKTFSLNSHNRLDKPNSGFPTFPQPLLLDIN